MEFSFFASNISDLTHISKEIIRLSYSKRKFLFYGEMGVGKTTLIKSILFQLGVKEIVTSPTFSIINEYFSDKYGNIYHFDFYRIKDEVEVYDIGYEEYFYSENYCFIEWPSKVENLLDDNMIRIYLETCGDDRIIKINL